MLKRPSLIDSRWNSSLHKNHSLTHLNRESKIEQSFARTWASIAI